MAVLAVIPYQQFFNPVTGLPLSFGTITTYAAGTTTLKATYSDQAGTVPLTNPIYLDAEGMPLASLGGARVHIWVDGSYKYVTKDSNGVTVDTADNVSSFVAGGASTIDINGMTENTGAAQDDYLPSYDTSAAANRKISFANVLGLIGPVITGFLPSSVTGTSTTAAMAISGGTAVATNATRLIVGTGYSWSVANGNNINGYQGGATLPNTMAINFFICTGSMGTGTFASTSLTPTLPTGYDAAYRRIFTLTTNGSGALLPVTAVETEGGSLVCYLVNPTNDANTTVGTTATLIGVNVPGGIKVQHIGRYWQPTGTVSSIILTSPDESDVVPSAAASGTGNGYDLATSTSYGGASSSTPLITNTSGQIRARSSVASTPFNVTTRGWKDFRRS